jgi:hypothetical protein
VSRCTPGRGWTSRMRKRGGMGPIQATRARQFQGLAAVLKSGTKGQKELAPHAIAFLESSPVRTLSYASEVFFGWIKVGPPIEPGYYDTLTQGEF